ncbi:MAG TPA: hypothetical protein VFH50_04810 [Acidimicrobiales bacterium]|nr:hypothetical protein [Acidimicrobiales bacterium]
MGGLLGVLLLVASCSTGASTTRGRPGDSSTTSTAAARVAADHARAQAAVLRLSDLPAGWTATPHRASPSVPGLDKRLAACLGVSVGLLNGNDPTNADSPDFSNANGGEISNSVGYEVTVGRARRVTAVLQSPKMAPCLNSALRTFLTSSLSHPATPSQSVPTGIGLGDSTTTRLSFPTSGDATVAYRFEVPIEGAGSPLTVYGDFVFAAKGRAGTVLTVESQAAPPDRTLEQKLVSTVVDRLE